MTCILQVATFVHIPSGNTIRRHTIVSGEPPKDFAPFAATVRVDVKHPNGMVEPVHKDVGFEAETVEDAFAMLPDIINRTGEKMIRELQAAAAEAERPKLVLASEMPKPDDRPPNGRLRFDG